MLPLVLGALAVLSASACGVLIGHEDLPERSHGPDGGADGAPPRGVDGSLDAIHPAGTLDRTFGDQGFTTLEWPTLTVPPSLMLDGEDILLVLTASKPGLAIVRCSKSGVCDTSHPMKPEPSSVSRVVPVRDLGGGVGLFYGLQSADPEREYENIAHLWRSTRDGGAEHLAQETLTAPTTQLEIAFATSPLRSVGVNNGGPRGAGRVNVRAFLQDGSPDMLFGQGGLVARALPVPYFVPNDVLLHDDGRIVVAGMAEAVMWMRFEKNGAVDTSFGTKDGVGTSNLASEIREIVLDDGGYIAGGSHSDTPRGVLLRLDRDGRIDPSYWNGGMYRFEISADGLRPPLALVGAMALGAGGSVLAFGSTSATETGVVTLSRVSRSGLDTSFAQNGYAYIEEGEIGGRASMVIQPDGKAVVTWLSAEHVVKLARFWVQ
ncbi:hypothetical protein LVJ94_19365 [Pendulispora rubella]|uniref:Delta-60 repeat domain-containing protein n=1 Tax=Pendulispora rubella TaxID=2741070 RepID=A0ABZ2LF42_9BACT